LGQAAIFLQKSNFGYCFFSLLFVVLLVVREGFEELFTEASKYSSSPKDVKLKIYFGATAIKAIGKI
jgi:hypothetical protein